MAKRRRSVVMQRRLIQRYLSHQREEGGAAVSRMRGRFQQQGNAVDVVMNTMVMEWWCSCV